MIKSLTNLTNSVNNVNDDRPLKECHHCFEFKKDVSLKVDPYHIQINRITIKKNLCDRCLNVLFCDAISELRDSGELGKSIRNLTLPIPTTKEGQQ